LTATVFGLGPLSAPSPTGTVNFLDTSNSNAQLASASLSTGVPSQTLSFISASNPTVSNLIASSATTGDFNGDGIPDLAVANRSNNTVQIFSGVGDGTFHALASYAVGNGLTALAASDLNSDGKLDLIAVNKSDSTVSVLLGNGEGTFTPQETYATGSAPVAVAAGDFNGDGKVDLVVAVNSGVSVLLGNGDGTLQPQQSSAMNASDYTGSVYSVEPQSVAVGDFNGDGKLDLATANVGTSSETSDSNSLSILLGNGDGTFRPAQYYTTGQPSDSVTLGDFNGDGKLDIAATNYSLPVTIPGESSVSVALGNGDGTLRPPVQYGLPQFTNPYSIQVGDFDGVGKADLVFASANGGQTRETYPDLVYVLLGNGDGTFQSQQGYHHATTPYGESFALALGDFNGDGKPDVVSLEQTYPAASIAAAILLDAGSSTSVTVAGVPISGTDPQLVVASYGGDSIYSASESAALSLNPIAPAPLTWAGPAPIAYGTPLDTTQLNATSTVAGTFVYSLAAGTVLGAGSQTLSVTFTPKDTTAYTAATNDVNACRESRTFGSHRG